MPLIQLTDVTLLPERSLHLPRADSILGKLGLARSRMPESHWVQPQEAPLILDHVTLTVRTRETMAVVGPSGSGKSTLIKVIAGLLKPSSGTVTYNQIPVERVPMRERRIGMVFQQQALYANMTSEENIGFYYSIRNQPELIPQRIKDVSRLMNVDLTPLLARRPPTLSGGENQRVAIARALAREVDIMLLDEPLSNLDVPLRHTLRMAMHRIFQLHPVTTLYVTHDQAEAMALANRIAVMCDGRIEQVGAPIELLERPGNTFVAEFFGSMNLLPGMIHDGCWRLGDICVDPPPAKAGEGKRITLGVRPNDFARAPDAAIPVRVMDTVSLYDRRIVQVHGMVDKYPVMIELPIDADVGEVVRVNPLRKHWFDTQSGYRLRL